MGEIKLENSDKRPVGIEEDLLPFVTAVKWRLEEDLPPLAEFAFPYADVAGRRLYLTNLVAALRTAFECGRPMAGGRS
jgi:hypothetical protein